MSVSNKATAASLRQTICRIFNEPYITVDAKRTGFEYLSKPLYGPSLKSHWPLRLPELTRFSRTPFSTEIPLPGVRTYVNKIAEAHAMLPHPVSRVYKKTIAEWRNNRGKSVAKGESKVTATNLGKIGSTKK